MNKLRTAAEAVAQIGEGAVVAVNASSGLCCPDAVLEALGRRYGETGAPAGLTMVHPIAAGDVFGTAGVDHVARPGCIARIIGGSYPSGPSDAAPPLIWQLIAENKVRAWNLPSGVVFDMLREGAGHRPGVLTKVGLDTFVDPALEGGAMNAAARAEPIVRRMQFEGEDWLFYPALKPDVAILRATTADERGNLSFESEGAYLGAMEMALAAHNCGGRVIAQVRWVAANGTLRPQDVHVPGILVDHVVVAPEMLQTTATPYDPAISGELTRPLDSFQPMAFDPQKVIARRVAQELKAGWAVNIGFGVSANVPRIFIEEGRHGAVSWVLEQGAVGGIPLRGFKFGCAANAEAFVTAPHQFTYFQAGGFDAALLSFLEIDAEGSVNVSRLAARPHRPAGAGGFLDITARAGRLIFSGSFNAGARMRIEDGRLVIEREGAIAKIVGKVGQVSFSGRRALSQGQRVLYVTERCVIALRGSGLTVTEIAPGIDLERDVLGQAETPLDVAEDVRPMDAGLFRPGPIGLSP